SCTALPVIEGLDKLPVLLSWPDTIILRPREAGHFVFLDTAGTGVIKSGRPTARGGDGLVPSDLSRKTGDEAVPAPVQTHSYSYPHAGLGQHCSSQAIHRLQLHVTTRPGAVSGC